VSAIDGRTAPRFAVRTCELCGEPFTPTNGRQRYCSEKHRRWHRTGVPTLRECHHCGATFTPERGQQRYCTREHHLTRRREAKRAATGTWEQRVRDLERAVAGARAELEGAIR